MDQYTEDEQFIVTKLVEAKLPIETHLLPFGKDDLECPVGGLAIKKCVDIWK